MMPFSSLPQYTTSLFGKAVALYEIGTRLHSPDCQLLTLVGPGGIGKTRLAVELISQADLEFPDGVYFVELQSVSSPDTIPQSIASALEYEYHNGSDLESELIAYLQEKRLLLVLDNFEHLLPARAFVMAMLAQASDLTLLITSRERLKLREECVYEVDHLSYPVETSGDALETYEAVQLFAEHAQRIRHDFSLHAESANVKQICRLTEGIPLAIELAAAWVQTLSCSEIADELQRQLDFLKTRIHDVPDRHRSMRAVFDHSWNLLSDRERHIMLGISVFQGSFHREAAQQITGATLDDLSSLVEKSLLRLQKNGRYSIHELQRRYAMQHLDALVELKQHLGDQHCQYYLALMNRPELDFDAGGFVATLRLIDADIANIRAAWRWAVEHQRILDLIGGMKGLYMYAQSRNRHVEATHIFQSMINSLHDVQQTPEAELVVGLALSLQGLLDMWLGRKRDGTRSNLEEGVSILRRLNARPELTIAVAALGWELMSAGALTTAAPLLEEAELLAQETNSTQFESFVIWLRGNLAVQRGRITVAEAHYRRAIALGKDFHDQRAIIFSLRALGDLAFEQGRYADARSYQQQSLEVAKDVDTHVLTVEIRNRLGMIALATGDLRLTQDYTLETVTRMADVAVRVFVYGLYVAFGRTRPVSSPFIRRYNAMNRILVSDS